MAEESKKGFLRTAFVGAAKLATIGLAAAVAWQIFLDPIFLPIFHDTSNVTAMAWRSMLNDYFGWIPKVIGLTGDGGLLQSQFAQSALSPYVSATPAQTVNALNSASGVDVDSVLGM